MTAPGSSGRPEPRVLRDIKLVSLSLDLEENPWAKAARKARAAYDLAMHLISMHADPMAVSRPYAESQEQHDYEHTGPGTIRNHPRANRSWDETKSELVLEECEANP